MTAIRFERPRVALDFRALADSLPAKAAGLGETTLDFAEGRSTLAALKAHINAAVQACRVRRGLPAARPFDLDEDYIETRNT